MKTIGLRAALFAGVAIAATGAVAAPKAVVQRADDLAAALGAREAISAPALSPDGKRIVYLTADARAGINVMVASAEGNQAPVTVTSTAGAAGRITGCDWADDTRLVCTVYVIAEQDGRTLEFQRMIAIDADGRNPRQLAQRATSEASRLRISQNDGNVIDWMQGGTGKLLLTRDHIPEETVGTRLRKTEDGYGVDIVDTHTLASSGVEPADPNAFAYIADGKGTVRIKGTRGSDATGYLRRTSTWFYRTPGDRRWRSLSTVADDGTGTGGGLRPISVDAATNSVLCTDKLAGRDALYRVSLDGSLTRTLVHSDPRVDVDGVVRLGRQARLIGASTTSETRNVVYFDPTYAALAKSLSKALPKLPIVEFVSASADENRLLLFAGSDVDPGRYYVFDRTTKRLNEIALVRPQLEKTAFAPMTSVQYPARDGTSIPAYLTLPPGAARDHLPAVVMPHGGPASRDEWGFDWLVQFYALSGFAVLQPQFRGSTGYGDDWMLKNGFQSWRTAIGDVVDSGRWLVAKGIADPDRLAIVGWSYGGYAALQSQVVEPGLFKAAVAIAPVTDFAALRLEYSRFTDGMLAADEIGSGADAQAGSPIRHAETFSAPVMMFHGTLDRNVSVEETRAMNARLRGAGKSATAVIYDGLDHSLPSGEIRADMLRRSDAFLRASLKMAAPVATPGA